MCSFRETCLVKKFIFTRCLQLAGAKVSVAKTLVLIDLNDCHFPDLVENGRLFDEVVEKHNFNWQTD